MPGKAVRAALEAMALFDVIALQASAAAYGGTLHARLANKGLTIGERDSMIAATARVNSLVMVTDNVSEFARVPGLVVENWRKQFKTQP